MVNCIIDMNYVIYYAGPEKICIVQWPNVVQGGEGLIVNTFMSVLFGFAGEKNQRSAFDTFVWTINRRKKNGDVRIVIVGAAIGVLRTDRREGREKGLFEGNCIGSTTYYIHIYTSIYDFIKKQNKHTASALSSFYDSLFRETADNGCRRRCISGRIDLLDDFFPAVWCTICTFLRKTRSRTNRFTHQTR